MFFKLKAKKNNNMINNSFIIYIKSNNKIIYKNYIYSIENLFKSLNFKNYKIQNKPSKIKKYSILKSPHVHKKFMESYEEIIYKTNIIIYNYNNINLLYLQKFFENQINLSINISFKKINKI